MSSFRTPWRAVAAMFMLNGGLFGIWASRIPAVAAKHELGPGALGLVLLMMAAGAILSFALAGRASDRLGAYRVTWYLALFYVCALVLLALAPTVPTLAAALFLFGAGFGAMDVTMNAWAGEVERAIGRPVMSSFHAMWSLGAGVGAGSGYLAVSWGVAIPLHFLVTGGLVALLTLMLARIGWVSDTSAHHAAPAFALPKGALLGVAIAAMCTAIGEGGMADWSAIFLIRTSGVSEAVAPLGFAAYSVAMVVMRLSGDWVVRRFGPVVAARFAGLSAATGAALAVGVGSFEVALIGFVLMGLGYALVFPLAFSRAANDPEIPPGAAIASVATLGYGGTLLGPPLIGFVAEATSVRLSFLILAVLALVVTLLAESLRQPARG